MLGKLGGVILSECWQSFIIKKLMNAILTSPRTYTSTTVASTKERLVGSITPRWKKTCQTHCCQTEKNWEGGNSSPAMSRKSMIPGAPSHWDLHLIWARSCTSRWRASSEIPCGSSVKRDSFPKGEKELLENKMSMICKIVFSTKLTIFPELSHLQFTNHS